MARSREELLALLKEFKGWYKQDFEDEYSLEFIKSMMEEMLQERIRKFLYRRIGHLPDADLISFINMAIYEQKAPVAIVVTPPKVEPVIETPKKPEPKKKT